MRTLDTVERHGACAAPGPEDADDGHEDGCMADPRKSAVRAGTTCRSAINVE
jgi:hypothetical protein